jgi:hypothetical protein
MNLTQVSLNAYCHDLIAKRMHLEIAKSYKCNVKYTYMGGWIESIIRRRTAYIFKKCCILV